MKRYILGIDEGTTSARAGIYDTKTNKLITVVQKSFKLIYPKSGWVEIDANAIIKAQTSAIMEAVAFSEINADEIACMGITNQRETIVAWNSETGKPICPAICWQCRRTADIIEKLTKQQRDLIKKRTGLIADAYFSATKIKWILENVSEAKRLHKQGKLKVGTIETFLVWKLTKGESFVTDVSNASRTMIFNIDKLYWDNDLLKLFNIPADILPTVVSNAEIVGYTKLLGETIPISGLAGDQQAALVGQACFNPGMVKTTFGTGGFLLMNTGNARKDSKKLLTTIAYKIGEEVVYAIEGSVFNCGSTVQWIRDGLGLIKKSADTEKMANSVIDNGGVYIVPAFTGLGAPYWDSSARGTICGLTRDTNKNHIARAVLECMAYSTEDILAEMRNSANKVTEMRADGGASENNFLMQFQSNISDVKITLQKNPESTLMGAIYLAGIGAGCYNSISQINNLWHESKVFTASHNKKQSQLLLNNWHKAVSKSLKWFE